MSRRHASAARKTLKSAREPWFPRPKPPTNQPSPRAWERLQRGLHRASFVMGSGTVVVAAVLASGIGAVAPLYAACTLATATLATAAKWSVDKPRGESATVLWYGVRTGLLAVGFLALSGALGWLLLVIVRVGAGLVV